MCQTPCEYEANFVLLTLFKGGVTVINKIICNFAPEINH